jgi:hypothetical protein
LQHQASPLGRRKVKRVRKWLSARKANPKAERTAPLSTGRGRTQGALRAQLAISRSEPNSSVDLVDRGSMNPDGDVQRCEKGRRTHSSFGTDGRSTAFLIRSITSWAAP